VPELIGDTAGDGGGDAGVGVQWQVRAVLLEGPDGHRQRDGVQLQITGGEAPQFR
jgi:hypothetical protein